MKLTKITYRKHDGMLEERVFKGNDWIYFLQETGYELIRK